MLYEQKQDVLQWFASVVKTYICALEEEWVDPSENGLVKVKKKMKGKKKKDVVSRRKKRWDF